MLRNDLLKILQKLHTDVNFESCETLIDDGILDSFDIVSIIAEINREFDIRVPAEEIIPDNFNSLNALTDLVERLEEND